MLTSLKWKNETCKAQKKTRNIRKAHNIHSAFEQWIKYKNWKIYTKYISSGNKGYMYVASNFIDQ